MKYGITLIVSLFFQFSLFGQAPANDECINAIDLGMAPSCDEVVYTNVNATTSNVGQFNLPDCWQGTDTDRDVWFSFTPSDTIADYRISVIGEAANGDPAIINPQVAVFRGSCGIDMIFPDAACAVAEPGTNEVTADFFGPDLGLTYYIRVNDFGEAGSFRLCVEARPEIYTIDEGGAEACSGFLFDTGGPNGNYGDNEDHTFTICPNVPNNCINMSFEYFNFESGFSESLTIYDGPDASGTQIAQLSSFDSPTNNAGGVCFQTSASSGCMTLVFQSDGQVNFEGFSAFWECSTTPCIVPAQLSVNTDVTPEDLALAIAGAETQLSVTSIVCPDGYYGTFNGEGTDLGLGTGIFLGSGVATNAIGPNNQGSAATIGDGPGDADLDSLSVLQSNGVLSEDACVVELEVQAGTEELVFEYVFGSEEYPEFVNDPNDPGGFNDVFGFFISGPDIVGIPALGDQINIAILPDGTPVEINNVNEGLNWQYYRNNDFGQSIQYDGLTSDSLGIKKSLTARATVTPCKTYRLKLAIADRGDSNYDSGVFISDIRSGAPEAVVNFVSGVDYLVEDCLLDVPDTLLVSLQNNNADSITYGVTIGGTATEGLDFLLPTLTDSISFGPGANEFKFPIVVLSDLLEEGVETITISFTIDFGCGITTASSIEIDLRDNLNIDINLGSDTIVYCFDNPITLTATGAADFEWLPADIFDDPTGATVIANPVGEVLVTAIGTLGSCVDSAQVLLIGVDPMIDILAGDTISACAGDTLTIFQENNIDNSNLTWSNNFNVLTEPSSDSMVIVPTFDQEVRVSVNLAGCIATDSVFIDFGPLSIPPIIGDTTICEGFPIQLVTTFFPFQTDFAWTPEEDFEDPSNPNSIVFPDDLVQTYTLISTSQVGACADTQMVTVTTIPSNLEILEGDLVEVCIGYDSVVLNAITTPVGSPVIWSPSTAGVLNNFGDSLSVRPDITVQYTATYTANGCTQSDTVVVKVDSLPFDMSITLDPAKDPYCQGDTFFLISPIYDVGDFSSITHMWIDAPGIQTGDSLYNGFVLAQDSSLFQRITMNGACSQTDSIQVNVVQPPEFSLTPLDTTICLGESVPFVFEILDGSMGTVSWEPDDGSLSCTDCFTPIATPTTATTYMITLTSEGSDCDFPISATINLFPPTELDVLDDPLVCPGTTLTLFQGMPQQGVTYQVTGPGVDTQDPLVQITVTESGSYEYIAFGPCDTITITTDVSVIQPVTLTAAGPTEACEGDLLTFTASTDAPDGQQGFFTWSVNGTVDPDGGLASFTTNLTAGTSTIDVTYTNDCEVVTTETITVEVSPQPSLELNPIRTICAGESVTLNLDPNVMTTNYVWAGSNGFVSTEAAPTVSPATTTTYTVTASSTGACDPITAEITIEVIEEYTLNLLEDLLICSGESINVTASTEPSGIAGTYNWTDTDGAQVATGATLDIVPDTTSTYTVTFTDGAGCFPAQSQSFSVEVIPVLEAPSIVVTDEDNVAIVPGDTVFNGETVILIAENGSPFDYTYSWEGNGDPTMGTGPMLTVITPVPDGDEGFLDYTLTYTTERGGCSATTAVSLPISRARFKIPDLITPNNDGTNDIFRIFYNGVITDYQMLVFNRWGQIVFETNDPDQGWNGTRDGKVQPMDVYLYRTKFNQNGQNIEQDGQFSLVR